MKKTEFEISDEEYGLLIEIRRNQGRELFDNKHHKSRLNFIVA